MENRTVMAPIPGEKAMSPVGLLHGRSMDFCDGRRGTDSRALFLLLWGLSPRILSPWRSIGIGTRVVLSRYSANGRFYCCFAQFSRIQNAIF